MPLAPEALYVQLGRLVETMPDLGSVPRPLSTEIHQWLGRAYVLVLATGDQHDAASFKSTVQHLNGTVGRNQAVQTITAILYRALATAELGAPAAAQGAFVPAGNAFDALAAFSKVLSTPTKDLLFIDPYMDEKVLLDFAPLAPEHITVRLLADQQYHKPSLRPAVHRWIAQYGQSRPIEARLVPARALHDRLLIVDGTAAWVLTQSMNAFATRSPASIVRADAETATLKVAAYEAMWATAVAL